jgi:acyl-CoA thioesterase FadM
VTQPADRGFPARLEHAYRVRFDEAGPDGMLRGSGFLRYAQDLAWRHSESAGFDRAWYAARGLTWLVRAVELDLLEDVAYGAEVTVSTEVTGFKRVLAQRRSEFDPQDGARTIAIALTDWVLLNEAGRLVRPPDEIIAAFGEMATFAPLRTAMPDPPPADAHSTQIGVRRSDLDPMAHVNNATYLDYVDEIFLSATGLNQLPLPRRYRAEFLYPAEPGANLAASAWQDSDAWWFSLTLADRPSFRAALEISPSRWVGG